MAGKRVLVITPRGKDLIPQLRRQQPKAKIGVGFAP